MSPGCIAPPSSWMGQSVGSILGARTHRRVGYSYARLASTAHGRNCSPANASPTTRLVTILQTHGGDGPVKFRRPHVDDVTEAALTVGQTCGRVHVHPDVRKFHVQVG